MIEVTGFAKGAITVAICAIPFGADFMVTQCTDTLQAPSAAVSEYLAFKHNIAVTAFVSSQVQAYAETVNVAASGRFDLGNYFLTDYWKNPVTGAIELIPDYNATTWTSAGAARFNVTASTGKTAKYPNHGQEMYDVSGGDYGYDASTGTSGSSNQSELTGLVASEKAYVKGVSGKDPLAISYRNGKNTTPVVYMPHYWSARNSDFHPFATPANTFYGPGAGYPAGASFRRDSIVDLPSTTRWYDYWNGYGYGNETAANNHMYGLIDEAETGNGWFRNFIHFHSAGVSPTQRCFQNIDTHTSSKNGLSLGYTQASEYLMLKNMVRRSSASEITGGGVDIYVELKDVLKDSIIAGLPASIDWNNFTMPLWVELQLDGTNLVTGSTLKNIESNVGRLIVDSTYVKVEIPVNHTNYREGFLVTKLRETTTSDYFTLAKPSVVSKSYSGGLVSVTCSEPCKVVVFNTTGAETSMTVVARSSTFKITHSISATVPNTGYIGIINKDGQSVTVAL